MTKVLLTREEEDIERDRHIFESFGLEVVSLPLIETKYLPFEEPSDYDCIVFQSQKAVKAFLSRASIKESARVFAVGRKTAEILEKFGIKAQYPEEAYAEKLLEMIKGFGSCKIVVPRSEIGRDELIQGLKAIGFEVIDIHVYTTVPRIYPPEVVERKLKASDFVVFASPSSVHALFANLPKQKVTDLLEGKKVVCIGKTTKGAWVQETGMDCLIPEEQSMRSIALLIKDLARSLH
ncbi:uroporphyrinogen-III synthase [Thermocrinis minervae]|uniref:Uroporphyrinogen-III synthase n=1 Tax=Thermocrinis minervae TaxID=381751 RepID=A0A1M6QXI9_9AQUI|nr:uroporphyrinogen-III synthase [Thermocrinis minervae]SHK24914.1 uroporphyrinogen-III synthase [Thermocrinis minervae]